MIGKCTFPSTLSQKVACCPFNVLLWSVRLPFPLFFSLPPRSFCPFGAVIVGEVSFGNMSFDLSHRPSLEQSNVGGSEGARGVKNAWSDPRVNKELHAEREREDDATFVTYTRIETDGGDKTIGFWVCLMEKEGGF